MKYGFTLEEEKIINFHIATDYIVRLQEYGQMIRISGT